MSRESLMTSLAQKQKNRFALLQRLYELTDGVPDRHSFDIREIGHELGMTSEAAINTFSYLNEEGLAKWMGSGGIGTIAHYGVKEIEDAQRERPTAHFPANIVMITGSPGAQVVQGSGNTVTSTTTVTMGDAVGQLRERLEAVETPLPSEAEELLEEAGKDEPNRFLLAQKADSLASKGGGWKTTLQEFAVQLAAGGGAGLLVEAIKFGLGMHR